MLKQTPIARRLNSATENQKFLSSIRKRGLIYFLLLLNLSFGVNSNAQVFGRKFEIPGTGCIRDLKATSDGGQVLLFTMECYDLPSTVFFNGNDLVRGYEGRVYVVKTDPQGLVQWYWTPPLPYAPNGSGPYYTHSLGLSITLTSDGGYAICGSIGYFDYPADRFYSEGIVAKLNSTGNPAPGWITPTYPAGVRYFQAPYHLVDAYSIIEAKDQNGNLSGDLVVASTYRSSRWQNVISLMRLNGINGTIIWNKAYQPPGDPVIARQVIQIDGPDADNIQNDEFLVLCQSFSGITHPNMCTNCGVDMHTVSVFRFEANTINEGDHIPTPITGFNTYWLHNNDYDDNDPVGVVQVDDDGNGVYDGFVIAVTNTRYQNYTIGAPSPPADLRDEAIVMRLHSNYNLHWAKTIKVPSGSAQVIGSNPNDHHARYSDLLVDNGQYVLAGVYSYQPMIVWFSPAGTKGISNLFKSYESIALHSMDKVNTGNLIFGGSQNNSYSVVPALLMRTSSTGHIYPPNPTYPSGYPDNCKEEPLLEMPVDMPWTAMRKTLDPAYNLSTDVSFDMYPTPPPVQITNNSICLSDIGWTKLKEADDFPPVNNWDFRVTSTTNGTEYNFTTNASGSFSAKVPYDVYNVREILKPGWIPVGSYEQTYNTMNPGNPLPMATFFNYECTDYCNMPENMISFWNFEETGKINALCDFVGGHAATLASTLNSGSGIASVTTAPTVPRGDINSQGIEFTVSYPVGMTVSHDPEYNFGTGEFTIEGWVYIPDLTPITSWNSFIEKGDRWTVLGGQGFWGLGVGPETINGTTDKVLVGHVGINNTINPISGFDYYPEFSTLVFQQGWNYVGLAVRRDGSDVHFVGHLNGVSQVRDYSSTLYNRDVDNDEDIYMAADFTGMFDEWSIYNRGLTDAEFQSIYAYGKCHEYARLSQMPECQAGNQNVTAHYNVYNGHTQSKEYSWAIAGKPGGVGDCWLDGPEFYEPNSSSFTVSPCSNSLISFDIPCDPNTQGYQSCFQLTMRDVNETYCLRQTGVGTSLQHNKKEDGDFGEHSAIKHDNGGLPDEGILRIVAVPNPFNKGFYIEFVNSYNEKSSLVVYDVLGRTVFESDKSFRSGEKFRIQVQGESLQPGIYFARCQVGNKLAQLKIVKTK
jgi:hypothetical protein